MQFNVCNVVNAKVGDSILDLEIAGGAAFTRTVSTTAGPVVAAVCVKVHVYLLFSLLREFSHISSGVALFFFSLNEKLFISKIFLLDL